VADIGRRGFLVGLLGLAAAPYLPRPQTARDRIEALVRALEAGGYNAAPANLVQGSALQVEDLNPVMECVTYTDESIVLQRSLDDGKSIAISWG
jgi:hypothetical protein